VIFHAIDRDLIAVEDVVADLSSTEDRLATAAADRLQLLKRVLDLERPPAAANATVWKVVRLPWASTGTRRRIAMRSRFIGLRLGERLCFVQQEAN